MAEVSHTHVNTHAHTVVYTLKWKPQRGCESRLWSRPGELLRSRLVSLALLQDRPQRLVTVRANRTVMGACLSSGFAVITPNEDSPTLLSGVIFDHREHSGVFISEWAAMRDWKTQRRARRRGRCHPPCTSEKTELLTGAAVQLKWYHSWNFSCQATDEIQVH